MHPLTLFAEKLSSIVRSLVVNTDNHNTSRSAQTTPVPWDSVPPSAGHPPYRMDQHNIQHRDMADPPAHMRNGSNGTSADSGMSQSMSVRRRDWDSRSLDSEGLSSKSHRSKNPIPNPSVSIRSELPTLTRSRQEQNLTCLVTVEMPEGKWQPDLEDLRSMRPRLSQTLDRNHQHGPSNASNRSNKSVRSNRNPTNAQSPPISQQPQQQQQQHSFPEPTESPEELERVTEDLHSRVDNWHGLDFSRSALSTCHGGYRRFQL